VRRRTPVASNTALLSAAATGGEALDQLDLDLRHLGERQDRIGLPVDRIRPDARSTSTSIPIATRVPHRDQGLVVLVHRDVEMLRNVAARMGWQTRPAAEPADPKARVASGRGIAYAH
jgi:hypothetical protein